MKKMMKRTAAVTLAGIMSVGMLTGCGSKTIDGTKIVATVDGTEIRLQMRIPERLTEIRQWKAA